MGEVESVMFVGIIRCLRVVVAADGAEESRLMEAQLLQLLWVLGECGREQQLLQWHLRRRQTEEERRMFVGTATKKTLLAG